MTSQTKAEKIISEKKKRGIVILAHTYQMPEIIDVADITGDSFKLSQAAEKLDCDTVIVCGVRFMAETVKMLSPEKRVILAAPEAKCAMAEQVGPKEIAEFKAANPDVTVCAYINTTSALKTEADVCVTSSSAVNICKKLNTAKILFVPDKNLGSFVKKHYPKRNLYFGTVVARYITRLPPRTLRPPKPLTPTRFSPFIPRRPPRLSLLPITLARQAELLIFALTKPIKRLLSAPRLAFVIICHKSIPTADFINLRRTSLFAPT